MSKFWFLCKEIHRGNSILRAYSNYYLQAVELRGKTVDVGGGSGWTEYENRLAKRSDVVYESLDLKTGSPINFETDQLPAADGTYDTVIFLNVLEHIYNHQHITNEVVRIIKPGGQLIGYVPFLMWYHPDHQDFFRYTHEALERILKKAGATNVRITPTPCGPFTAGCQMFLLTLPCLLRTVTFTFFYGLDRMFFYIKGNELNSRYVLGYLFTVRK